MFDRSSVMSADHQGARSVRDYEVSSSFTNSEKGRTRATLRKIRFTARRALQLVSRSIDHRANMRSESEGDIICGSQLPADCLPRSPVASLTHRISRSSLTIRHALSTPFSKISTDNSTEMQKFGDGHRREAEPALSPQPPQQQEQLQEGQQWQQQQQHKSTIVPTFTSKPRSLLSALLKRPSISVSASTPDSVSKGTPALSYPSPTQEQATNSPGPLVLNSETTATAKSFLHGELRKPTRVPPAPQQACPLGRLYESLPGPQECDNSVPQRLLVPQKPHHSTAAECTDLSLSAPSPHMASLKRALLTAEREDAMTAAVVTSLAQPAVRLGATSSTSTASTSITTTTTTTATTTTTTTTSPIANGTTSPLVSTSTTTAFAESAAKYAAVPVACPPRSPRMPLIVLGGAEEPAPGTSIPATSILASSLGYPGGIGGFSRVLQVPKSVSNAQVLQAPSSSSSVATSAGTSVGATAGPSLLLAMGCNIPPAMQRSSWTLVDYSLHKRLYKGKMASVYKGRCLRSGLPVALKVYFKERVPANVVHMIMREVSIHLQASEHKNVLKLYGVFQNEDVVVMVMELASRGSLSSICQNVNGGRLSEPQVRQTILEPLLDALSYLHSQGICHRDIKPENLLYTSDWGFRLADFGVSINLLEERAVTRAGTADYMAPEVERCPLKSTPEENKEDASLSYTTAADVWSVGVLAYELLVGFPPVVLSNGIARPLSFPASVSAGARDFIRSALAQLPEERPTIRQLRCHPWILAAGAPELGRRQDIAL